MKLRSASALLSFALACCCYTATAQQGIVKTYAYQRAYMPGTIPTVIDENGSVKERPGRDNYYRYIFMEHKSSVKNLRPLKAWIGKKAYALSYEDMKATPLIVPGVNGKKDTLVPPTGNVVLQVLPGQALPAEKLPVRLKKSIQENELVILYQCGNKIYHTSITRLKNLPSFAMQ